jgi:preprotein translocase subunit SecB
VRPSVIQLREVLFHKVLVEASKRLEDTHPGEANNFDFDEVNFRVRVESGPAKPKDGAGDNDRTFGVVLGVAIDNVDGKVAPYKIDVLAVGLVEISDIVEKDKRADLATVSGTNLVYGAIRELVMTLTSRAIPGPLMLPTMDFRDYVRRPSRTS